MRSSNYAKMAVEKRAKLDEPANSGSKEVRRTGNRIYFYSDVTQESITLLLDEMFAVDRELNALYEFPYINEPDGYTKPPIILEINSFGGDAVEILRYLDKSEEISRPIWTVCAGMCASAATIMAISGDYRLMYPRAYYHIHSLSAGTWGKYEELEDKMEWFKKLQEEALNIYVKNNSAGLDEEAMRAIMAREKLFSAEEALKNGFIDKIIGK